MLFSLACGLEKKWQAATGNFFFLKRISIFLRDCRERKRFRKLLLRPNFEAGGLARHIFIPPHFYLLFQTTKGRQGAICVPQRTGYRSILKREKQMRTNIRTRKNLANKISWNSR